VPASLNLTTDFPTTHTHNNNIIMTSILILTDDEPHSTTAEQSLHEVVIEIDDNGDGHVVKNRHGSAAAFLDSRQPGQWRDFIQSLALS
jgi:hypothetical protein